VSAASGSAGAKPVPLTAAQRWLAVATGLVSTALAVLGGLGSFAAVAAVAAAHGFTDHPGRVPLAVDLGIVGLILADLLLTWLDMPFPPLRWLVWLFVGATVWFNMAAAWGDPIGMAMHAAAPTLLVTWVEGVRHATRTRARMASTRRRHIEGSPLGRWLLAPLATVRLWRRQQLWHVTSYADALVLERQRLLAIARLRSKHGLLWRWKAPISERYAMRFGFMDPSTRPASAAAPVEPAPISPWLPVAALERSKSQAAPRSSRSRSPRPTSTRGKVRQHLEQQRAAGAERPSTAELMRVAVERFGATRGGALRALVLDAWPEAEAAAASPDGTEDPAA
jgi:Protein of unknown function (DUF2637)